MYGYYSILFCNQEQVMIAWVELFIFASVWNQFNFHYLINLTLPTFTAASTMQFAVVILLEKKLDFKTSNAKKKKRGQPGLTLENIEKPLIHFASPRPRKPLNCLKKLSPSPKTIEEFGKPPPVPFPCDWGGDREGDPFIQCPLPSSLHQSLSLVCTQIYCYFMLRYLFMRWHDLDYHYFHGRIIFVLKRFIFENHWSFIQSAYFVFIWRLDDK